MADVIVSLVPLAVGIVMSPLAIMALVAVLLSQRARTNGLAFLAGWAVAVALSLTVSFVVFGVLEVHQRQVPPVWVPIVRLALAVALGAAAVWIYRRGKAHAAAMARARTPEQVADAAPQLPGWLQKVDTFTPPRSFALGLAIFLINPVDASCAILASLDVRIAALDPPVSTWVLIVFGLVAVAPIGVPVALVLTRGAAAAPALSKIRTWIATHTSVLNAALVLVIAVLQLQKAVSTFLAY